ncbi:MAG: type II secretion system protein [Synergistaceae bacterium]|nr:type II secretion system protein [Synergistaceae bacterium]
MKKGRASAFTLVEILLVVGLVGIIAAVALAPLVFTVRSLEDAQSRWGNLHNTASAADKIYSDVRRVIENPSFSVFRIIHKSGLTTEADDRLVMWSAAPKYEGRNVGVVIYKVVAGNSLNGAKSGLYRWVRDNVPSRNAVSGDLLSRAASDDESTPMDIDTDSLDPKDAKLILAGAEGVRFFVRQGKKWEQEYEGSLPPMLKTEIVLKDEVYSRTERFPNASGK